MFNAIMEDFEDSVFGAFYNRRNKEQFVEDMTREGWKYFSVKNLNELFSIFAKEHPPVEIVEQPPVVAAPPVEEKKPVVQEAPVPKKNVKTEEKKKPQGLQIEEY